MRATDAENAVIDGEPLIVPARVQRVTVEERSIVIDFPPGSVPRTTRWQREPGTVGSRIPARAVAALYHEAPGAEMPWHIEPCSITSWLHFTWEAWTPYLQSQIEALEESLWTMCTPFDELSAETSLEALTLPRKRWSSTPEQVLIGARFDIRRANLS